MSVLRKHTTPKCRSEVSVMRLGGGVAVNGKTLLGLSTYLNLLDIRNNIYRSNLSTVTTQVYASFSVGKHKINAGFYST